MRNPVPSLKVARNAVCLRATLARSRNVVPSPPSIHQVRTSRKLGRRVLPVAYQRSKREVTIRVRWSRICVAYRRRKATGRKAPPDRRTRAHPPARYPSLPVIRPVHVVCVCTVNVVLCDFCRNCRVGKQTAAASFLCSFLAICTGTQQISPWKQKSKHQHRRSFFSRFGFISMLLCGRRQKPQITRTSSAACVSDWTLRPRMETGLSHMCPLFVLSKQPNDHIALTRLSKHLVSRREWL